MNRILARLFGLKAVSYDKMDGYTLKKVAYYWRGCYYTWSYEFLWDDK